MIDIEINLATGATLGMVLALIGNISIDIRLRSVVGLIRNPVPLSHYLRQMNLRSFRG